MATVSTLLPLERYRLTSEDKQRFKQEQDLGMVLPHDPVLRQVASVVDPKTLQTPQVQDLIHRLYTVATTQQHIHSSTKKRRTLVGLAAPQIGQSTRIIVVDTKIGPDCKKPGKLECFINPQIVWRSRETEEGREGCFSAGPVWGLVRRSIAIKLRALTPTGKTTERIFEDFTARIIQHECDHLNGIRFADRIRSDSKRHWVHTEEFASYVRHIHHWPRLCSRERWETLTLSAEGIDGD